MSSKSPETKLQSEDRFESDTQKIVRRHLEDPNHKITEEELRNVRIGMTPVIEHDSKDQFERTVNEIEENNDDDIQPNDEPTTSWDTIKR